MIPYLLLLLTVSVVAFAGHIQRDQALRRLSAFVIAVMLVLFQGLRSPLVGTDSGNYVSTFLKVGSIADIWQTPEIGYNALMVAVMAVSNQYAALFLAISLIVVANYVRTILRLVERFDEAIYALVALGVYTFSFNGARQGIAASICFLALPHLLERRPLRFAAFIGVAMLFHTSAVVALMFYVVGTARTSWVQIALAIVGTVAASFLISDIGSFAGSVLNDRYAQYTEASEGGGTFTFMFLLVQGAALGTLKYFVNDSDGKINRLLNIYLFGLIPPALCVLSSANPSGLFRLQLYFTQVAVLLWPMILSRIPSLHNRMALKIPLLLGLLMAFTLATSQPGNLTPYELNPEIVHAR